MPWPLRYAARHLGRRPRESLLLGAVIFVAAAISLAQLAQRRGVEARTHRLLADALAGEVVIDAGAGEEPVDVLATQPGSLPVLHLASARAAAERAGLRTAPRLRFGALIGRDERSIGVIAHAVTAERFTQVARLLELPPGGPPAGEHPLLVSDMVAKYLGCREGDTLAVLATNRAGYLSDAVLVVRGIFATRGAAAFLTGVAFLPYADGATLLGLGPDETLELAGSVAAGDGGPPAIPRTLRAGSATLRVTPWQESAPLVMAVITVWGGAGLLTQLVLSAVAFLLVINAVLATLHDRTREVGTLSALGMQPPALASLLAAEYLLLTLSAVSLAAVVVGLAVALAGPDGIPLAGEALQAAYMGRRLQPILQAGDVLRIAGALLLVVLGALALPVRRLLRQPAATLLRTAT
ncbi:MAG: ABC transporter permease [Gemmatimonadaceae bacterium]